MSGISEATRTLMLEAFWLAGTVDVYLCDDRYFFEDVHASLADIPQEARLGPPAELVGRRITRGAADADDIEVAPPPRGSRVVGVALVMRGADEASSRLLAYLDSVDGLPTLANGQPILLRWSDGPNRIFRP